MIKQSLNSILTINNSIPIIKQSLDLILKTKRSLNSKLIIEQSFDSILVIRQSLDSKLMIKQSLNSIQYIWWYNH